jgi:Domain of unknown function (DUF6894)
MPRYFFHIRTPEGCETDATGVEFDSLEDAMKDARRARGEMVADEALGDNSLSTRMFEITDQSGNVLATLPLLDP